MNCTHERPVVRKILAAATCALISLCATSAHAQSSETKTAPEMYQTLFLSGINSMQDAVDIVNDIRNMLPKAKVYYVSSEDAISIRGSADDVQLAQKILTDMNRTRKPYRLTYTITDTENSREVGTQRVSMILVPGQRSMLKMGSKVPIITGKYTVSAASAETEMQYLDVGLNIDARLGNFQDGLKLNTKIEQSNVADEKSPTDVQDPVLHQAVLETTTSLSLDKPTEIGAIDIPGSTRHRNINVSVQPIP